MLSVISCIALALGITACKRGGETIPRHKHEYIPTVIEATCTAKGHTEYNCECGSNYVADYTDPLGHDYDGDECVRCGWIRHDHVYEKTTVEPTCDKQGYTQGVCSICGATYKTNFTEPLGHKYENGECTVCGHFDPAEHNHEYEKNIIEPDCLNGGYTEFTCYCGESYTGNYTEPLGHSHIQGKCIRCGDILGTAGLEYRLVKNTHYVCTGIGTATDSDIIIAPEYNGLPVTGVDENAFINCTQITGVVIFENIGGMSAGAFANCTNLKSVTLSEGLYTINNYVFSGCSALKSISIPKNVSFIGEYAFLECESLESLTVAEGNRNYHSVGNFIIDKNKNLVLGSVNGEIPDDGSVTSIGDSAFAGRKGLKSVIIPESVQKIGTRAFGQCKNLESVTICDGVEEMDTQAFYGCENLKNLIVANSVTGIDGYTFGGCNKIENITAPLSVLSKCSLAELRTVVITDGTNIYDKMFINTKLTSVVIGDSVTSISSNAFSYCKELKSVTIGKGVTSISRYAFAYCYNLADIYYGGTAWEWAIISKGTDWDLDTGRDTDAGTYTEHFAGTYTLHLNDITDN